jgi:hypothetical protein
VCFGENVWCLTLFGDFGDFGDFGIVSEKLSTFTHFQGKSMNVYDKSLRIYHLTLFS